MTLEQTRRRRQAVEHHSRHRQRHAGHRGRAHPGRPARPGRRTALPGGRAASAPALCTAESGPLRLPTIARPARRLLLVLTSEQPLCGPFNQDVLALAERRRNELRRDGEVHLVVVGQRGKRALAAHGIEPDAGESAATSLAGLRDLVKRLAALVDRRYAAGRLGALHVIYNRYQSVSEQVPTEERVLPLDLPLQPSIATPPTQEFYRYLELQCSWPAW